MLELTTRAEGQSVLENAVRAARFVTEQRQSRRLEARVVRSCRGGGLPRPARVSAASAEDRRRSAGRSRAPSSERGLPLGPNSRKRCRRRAFGGADRFAGYAIGQVLEP